MKYLRAEPDILFIPNFAIKHLLTRSELALNHLI